VNILAVAHSRELKDPLFQAGLMYLERCQAPFKTKLELVSPDLNSAKQNEALLGASIAGVNPSNRCLVVLDPKGELLSSEAFSARLKGWLDQGKKTVFLIGGASGHTPEVRQAASTLISLSPMTLPHRMAFLVLAEQIYRAQEIARNGPYHK
jgi:23S rRNA (pseudouridine1915-N3)-methyltransferase